jgi:putative protease
VRSLGALQWLQNRTELTSRLVGDHSLNICNSLCAEWFQQHGLDLLHPSWDLNRQQMLDLLKQFGGASFELGLHLYIPTYHMEHCVFAAFLSKGSKYPDCKVPCMVHQVEVEDHKGEKHYLQSDAECRNTLYLGRPQSMVKLVPDLLREGVRRFRIEMLQESAQQVQDKVQAYSDLLRGKLTADQVFRQLGVAEKYGITEGQLFNETRWIDRKQNR